MPATNVYPHMHNGIAIPRAAPDPRTTAQENARIAEAVAAQAPRLRAFVRRRVADLQEVDDIVQDTFAELVCAYRLMEPIEHVAAWLLRVARNRIIDRFRRGSRNPTSSPAPASAPESAAMAASEEDWPAQPGDEPEAAWMQEALTEELLKALAELPVEQREVFVAHELDGRSFKELAAESGIGINTLLGRKHAAVQSLRRRLRAIHAEFEA